MTKRALITGVTGQDGSYLVELLLDQGYEVHGVVRRSATPNTRNIDHLIRDPHEEGVRFFLHHGDLADGPGLRRILEEVRPHEVYNLAAQSHVGVSFEQAIYTVDVVGLGALRLLEAIRDFRDHGGTDVRYYQASSSEMFGAAPPPQSLDTPFHPRSPYACAKAFAHHQTVNYREAYGLFACSGILFNHESPRRGVNFVTRKITRAVGRIKLGLQDKLYLGNLDARRDWGHAQDYVEAMFRMLQQDEPADYLVATGEHHSVRDFARRAFAIVDLDHEDFVEVDPQYFRPSEAEAFLGDPEESFRRLGWRPQRSFDDLVREMVEHDLALARHEQASAGAP